MSFNDGDYLKRLGINMDSLEKEMNTAIEKDSRYWLENDAKLRAVKQGVPTYEDFRQIVAGCHLRPLERSEILRTGASAKPNWNNTISTSSCSSISSNGPCQSIELKHEVKTSQEFLTHWRLLRSTNQLNEDEKCTQLAKLLLQHSSNLLLKTLLDTGLGVPILPDIFYILDFALKVTNLQLIIEQQEVFSRVMQILLSFSQSKQFKIALDCFSEEELIIVKTFLEHLELLRIQLKLDWYEQELLCLKQIRMFLDLN